MSFMILQDYIVRDTMITGRVVDHKVNTEIGALAMFVNASNIPGIIACEVLNPEGVIIATTKGNDNEPS